MTRAPRSASCSPAYGPAMNCPSSRTRTPFSGLDMDDKSALVGLEPRAVRLVVEELLHSLRASLLAVEKTHFHLFRLEVIGRLLDVHAAHVVHDFLYRLVDLGIFREQRLRELHGFLAQLRARHGEVHQAYLRGDPAVEGLAGERVPLRIAVAAGVQHHLRDEA